MSGHVSPERPAPGAPVAAPITLKWLLTRMNEFVLSHVSHNFAADGANHGMCLKINQNVGLESSH